MSVKQEGGGEWLDKEPRADGKPRRWRPFEILAVEQGRVFTQERKTQRPSDDTHPHDRTST
jgi:hypothetical protein